MSTDPVAVGGSNELRGPSTVSIESTNTFEQPVRGRILVRRLFRYLLPQFLDGARLYTRSVTVEIAN